MPTSRWTQLSIDYANQRNYLDSLFEIYPTVPGRRRRLDDVKWTTVENAFKAKKKKALLVALLKLRLFPIKDSYVAFLRRDPTAIARNPRTVQRLARRLLKLDIHDLHERSSQAKETNRQLGPMFREWIKRGALGVPILQRDNFLKHKRNCVLDGSDAELGTFAKEQLGYRGGKGLDLVAKFGGRYVVGEAKFLTDNGGHQNAQFEDAMRLLSDRNVRATKVAILDGVLYLRGRKGKGTKMFRRISSGKQQKNIVSGLLLREFLFAL